MLFRSGQHNNLNKQEPGFGDSACIWGTRQTNSKTPMETKVFPWLQPSKLETYRAHNKTVEKTHFYRANHKMVELTHFYRDYQHQQNDEDKVHPRVLSISKATRPSRRLICSLLFLSVHAIPEKLAQRLLVSGLCRSVSLFSSSVPPTLGFSVSF